MVPAPAGEGVGVGVGVGIGSQVPEHRTAEGSRCRCRPQARSMVVVLRTRRGNTSKGQPRQHREEKLTHNSGLVGWLPPTGNTGTGMDTDVGGEAGDRMQGAATEVRQPAEGNNTQLAAAAAAALLREEVEEAGRKRRRRMKVSSEHPLWCWCWCESGHLA